LTAALDSLLAGIWQGVFADRTRAMQPLFLATAATA
jgi:hypothetical protein